MHSQQVGCGKLTLQVSFIEIFFDFFVMFFITLDFLHLTFFLTFSGQRHPKMTKFGRAKFESGICDDRDFLNLACYATVDSR